MVSNIDLFTALLLWLCTAAAWALFVLATSAHRIETECGLPTSPGRLIAAGALALMLSTLTIGATLLRVTGPMVARAPQKPQPGPPASLPPNDPRFVKLAGERDTVDKQLDDLKTKSDALEAKRRSITARIRSLGAANPTQSAADASPAPPAAPWFDVGSTAAYAAPALLLIGLALMVFLGDPRNLVPQLGGSKLRSHRRLKAIAELDRLVEQMQKERYLEAILMARELDERALDRLDALDLLYFKGYCAVQLTFGGHLRDKKDVPLSVNANDLLAQGIRDLESLLAEAPNHAEAAYVLALARSYNRNFVEALRLFEQVVAALPGSDLPLAHNRSVCLMNLAEQQLGEGNVAGADERFRAVDALKVMADKIPTSWVKVRFQNVRQSLRADNFSKASAEIASLRQTERLDEAQHKTVSLICAAFETLIPLRQANDERAVEQIEAFLRQYLPAELNQVGDEIADEHVDTPVDRLELPLARDVYRALLFTLSAARARLLGRRGRAPSAAEVNSLVEPLLCAFQFQLRQRDLLAALGGLYYWFHRDERLRALEWIRSALDMGATSLVARRILERDRLLELQQRETLAWFRSKSARFLRDPTLKRQVRDALVEELGRFQQYQPLLLDLEASPSDEPSEPTVATLRDRAKYIGELAAYMLQHPGRSDLSRLTALRAEYARVVQALEDSSTKLSVLEKDVVMEVSKVVLS